MTKSQLSQRIKYLALELGFDTCGIAKVEELTEEKHIIE